MIGSTRLARLKGALRNRLAAWGGPGLGGPRDGAPRVLCYHGVCVSPPDEWSVTPAQFREQLAVLRGEASPVSLAQILSWLVEATPLPERAVAITFDDGYADVFETAAPLLSAHGLTAAVFVVTGWLDGQKPHPSYRPSRPPLGWPQVRELHRSGFPIGSHTVSHPILARLSTAQAWHELSVSKRRLDDEVFGNLPSSLTDLLAFPYGTGKTVTARDFDLARKAGYKAAFLNAIGSLAPGQHRFALPRCKVLGSDGAAVFRASITGRLDLWRHIENRRFP